MNKHLGVRYVYDESDSKQDSIQTEALTLTPEALDALSADWFASLHRATINSNFDLMLTLIAQIHELDEPLANALANLVNDFPFEKLLSITQSRAI